jgi:hypothetical protein
MWRGDASPSYVWKEKSMNSDAFYTIGKTHKVCQDYALAGRSKSGKAFAIVSDGCSSSPHTDVGARLLVWAAKESLESDRLPDIESIIRRAYWCATASGFPQTCLDATLALVYETAKSVDVKIWGDGVVITKGQKEKTALSWIEYGSGAPFYPSYLLDQERLEKYHKEYGNKKRYVHGLNAERKPFKRETSVEESLTYSFSHNGGSLILIGSDGVMAFGEAKTTETSKTINPVEPERVAEKLAAIKSFKGEFVTRRCNRFLSKQCPQLNWEPQDDMAIGGIYLGGSK